MVTFQLISAVQRQRSRIARISTKLRLTQVKRFALSSLDPSFIESWAADLRLTKLFTRVDATKDGGAESVLFVLGEKGVS